MATTRRQFLRSAGYTSALVAAAGAAAVVPGTPGFAAVAGAATGDKKPWWLRGNFAPVRREVTELDLDVTGHLPPELTGLFVRNGSNPANGPSPHWFLGDGMIHGVRLDRGKARWYRNRWVGTEMLESGIGVLSAENGGGSASAPGGANNQSNVALVSHGDKLLSLGEVGFPFEISTDDLSTVGAYDYEGRLTTAMTAHPKIDPKTGQLHFFGYGFVAPFLTYHVADEDGTLVHSEEIPVGASTMMHDFAITDRDVIFWELPVLFDLELAVRGEMPYRWDPSYGARLGVMPLGGAAADIRWAEIDPCYVFHGINAYRNGDDIVVDVCRMPDVFVPGKDFLETVSRPHRFTIDTSGPTLAVTDERLANRQMDLPTIDPRRRGLPNRYAWFAATRRKPRSLEFGGVVQRDLRRGRNEVWEPGRGRHAGEGLFVAGDRGEGEGWVLTFLYDSRTRSSDLVVLDTSEFARGPVARVRLPQRVPFGFHGAWVPA
ncbi:MAG TPA: carotenoid oxygenase family protein [Acidimicrobiia bacterium]|nr:carotenoid oxygenase family protein [Acidimicrobiia bacterium]